MNQGLGYEEFIVCYRKRQIDDRIPGSKNDRKRYVLDAWYALSALHSILRLKSNETLTFGILGVLLMNDPRVSLLT